MKQDVGRDRGGLLCRRLCVSVECVWLSLTPGCSGLLWVPTGCWWGSLHICDSKSNARWPARAMTQPWRSHHPLSECSEVHRRSLTEDTQLCQYADESDLWSSLCSLTVISLLPERSLGSLSYIWNVTALTLSLWCCRRERWKGHFNSSFSFYSLKCVCAALLTQYRSIESVAVMFNLNHMVALETTSACCVVWAVHSVLWTHLTTLFEFGATMMIKYWELSKSKLSVPPKIKLNVTVKSFASFISVICVCHDMTQLYLCFFAAVICICVIFLVFRSTIQIYNKISSLPLIVPELKVAWPVWVGEASSYYCASPPKWMLLGLFQICLVIVSISCSCRFAPWGCCASIDGYIAA